MAADDDAEALLPREVEVAWATSAAYGAAPRRVFWSCAAIQAVTVALGCGALWHVSSGGAHAARELAELRTHHTRLQAELRQLQEGGRALGDWSALHPFEVITHSPDHKLPDLYGKVKEKTIWSYWFHPASCPNSTHCTLPAHIQLCIDTVNHNRGDFDFRLVHKDEVHRYVSGIELPVRWNDLAPAQAKDALMNALLARYGGISWDVSMILLRPVETLWDEMLKWGYTFRGYMYRINGVPWRHVECMAVWFMMSRREGVFAAAVRSQVIGMGDRGDTGGYIEWYRALGDHTITPILSMFNYSLPKCFDDEAVPRRWACPEKEQPAWYQGITGDARSDARIWLEDPRDGPQLPMAWLGMETFNISDTRNRSKEEKWAEKVLGAPMRDTTCASMKQCWDEVFLPRLHDGKLKFVKFFNHAALLQKRSREELLADKDTYFFNWLRLAGLPAAQ